MWNRGTCLRQPNLPAPGWDHHYSSAGISQVLHWSAQVPETKIQYYLQFKKKMLLKKHFVHLIYVYHLFISFNYWLFFLRSFLYLLYKKMWNISFYISKNFPPWLFYYWTIMWCDSLSYHALVTVGQQEDQSQLPDPLILSTGNKLVNDWLSCVGKVSKLGLPQDQTVGIHLAEAHLKPCNTPQRYITQVTYIYTVLLSRTKFK